MISYIYQSINQYLFNNNNSAAKAIVEYKNTFLKYIYLCIYCISLLNLNQFVNVVMGGYG